MTSATVEELTARDAVSARRFGRQQIVGTLFGVLGIVLVAALAPNITSETRSFAFEPPPDPLQWDFTPSTLVTVIGVVYIIAAALSFLPGRDTVASRSSHSWSRRRSRSRSSSASAWRCPVLRPPT